MSERYEIRTKLGEGGLGAVFRAFDNQLRREVALKRVLTPTQEAVENLQREATALSSLMHPNIVTVFDVGQDEDGGFVVMELLDGETLDDTIARAPLTLHDFVEVVNQTMEALIAAQAVNMTHRDLKPGNIMVIWRPSGRFQIKVLDFGLAKISTAPSPQTMDQEEGIMGSIYFMAPEQFERATLDFRTDMYAMGCIYYYCLTGRYPFDGESAMQVMYAHLQHTVPPLEELRPDLPVEVSRWVMWLLARSPEDRPGTAREAIDRFPDLTRPTPVASGPIPQDGTVRASPAPAFAGTGASRTTSTKVPLVTRTKTGTVTRTGAGKSAVAGGAALKGPSKAVAPAKAVSPAAAARALAEKEASRRRLAMFSILSGISVVALILGGSMMVVGKMGAAKEMARIEQLDQDPMGDAKDVKLLLRHISEDARLNDARSLRILTQLRGPGVEEALRAELARSRSSPQRLALLHAVANRSMGDSFPVVLEIYQKSAVARERATAAHAMAQLARPGDEKVLLEFLKAGGLEGAERTRLEEAVTSILYRNPSVNNRVEPLLDELDESSGDYRKSLARILGALGGKPTLDRLARVFGESGADKAQQLDLMIALNSWPNRGCKDILEGIIGGTDRSLKPLASRAYLRMLQLPSSSVDDTAGYRLILDNVDRTEARRVFGAIMARPTAPALKFCQEAKYPGLESMFTQAVTEVQKHQRNAHVIRPGEVISVSRAAISGESDGTRFLIDEELTDWQSPRTWLSWVVRVDIQGTFEVSVLGGVETEGSDVKVTFAGAPLEAKTRKTTGDGVEPLVVGQVKIDSSHQGIRVLSLSAGNVAQPGIMRVRGIRFARL